MHKYISVRRGFTLVELLVVIASVGILAALLFPVFAQARRDGQRTACISNMHQVGLDVSMYLQDFDGAYPYADNPADRAHPDRWKANPAFMAVIPSLPQFHVVMRPYTVTGEVFHCPADFGLQINEFVPGWDLEANPSSFAIFGTSYFYHTRLALLQSTDSSVPFPADTLVLMDADGKWHGSPSEPQVAFIMRRYNLLFGDGHVKNWTHGQLNTVWDSPQ